MKTFFQMKCPGWQGADGYIIYKVYHLGRLLQHGNEPILSPMLLPLGNPDKNYTDELTVKICDKHGSCSEEMLTVKVSRRIRNRTISLTFRE